MNPAQLMNLCKEKLATAEKSKLLNQRVPVPRSYREPFMEKMRWSMFVMSMSEKRKKEAGSKHLMLKSTIVSGDSHSCKTPFEHLKPIHLCDMQVPKVHKGCYLVCNVVGAPDPLICTAVMVEDLNGDVEQLDIYNYTYNVEDTRWISIGTILIIKEPYLRFGSQNLRAAIRVDSPSDLIFVDPTDFNFLKKLGVEEWYQNLSKNPDVIREEGNKCFLRTDYEAATFLYNRAIRYAPDMAVLYLNKASSQLRFGSFEGAYESAKTALDKRGDREKALFRMGLAAYGMRNWTLAVDHFQTVCDEFPKNKDVEVELNKAKQRLLESQNGHYDWKAMHMAVKNWKREFDVADYIGPIEVVDVPGKGKGVIAKEDISKGTLILVAKPFAAGYAEDFSGYLTTVNMIQKKSDEPDEKLQMIRAIEEARKNPSKVRELYKLYAGKLPRDEDIPDGVIDTARIEQISVHNRFSIERENKDVFSISSGACGLYLLPSYFNHDCMANTKRSFLGDVMLVHAVRDLKKNEELTLHYKSPLIVYSERVEVFKHWGFICQCRLCKLDSKDANCTKRAKLLKQFHELAERFDLTPSKIITQGKPLLMQMRHLCNNRSGIKIELVQLLCGMGRAYCEVHKPKDAINCFEEAISLVDEELELYLGIPKTLLKLADCYKSDGQEEKAKETVQKAYKMSLCTDVDHFKTALSRSY